jgi:hypothetical protein
VQGLKPPGYQAPFSYGSGGVNVRRPTSMPALRAASGMATAGPMPARRVALTPGGCQIGYMDHQNSTYGLALTPGRGCQIGYMCDQNSTYGLALTPGRGCQIGYMCDQNSTYGLALIPGGCQIGYMDHQNSTYGLHSLPGGVRLVTWTTRTRLWVGTHSQGVSDSLHTSCHHQLLSTAIRPTSA